MVKKKGWRILFVAVSIVSLDLLLLFFPSPLTTDARQVHASPMIADSTLLGTNLIINGDAESGLGSPDGSLVTIPGWYNVGNYATVVQYGATGAFLTMSSPGPSARGANFFAGGPDINGGAVSYLVQTIDVSSLQSLIDSGSLSYTLAGWFGGYSADSNYSGMKIFFLDASNNLPEISSSQVGPVTVADRNNTTGLFRRSITGTVPPQTRFILINLDFNRWSAAGTYNDGFADDVSLVLGSRVFVPGVFK